MPVWYFAYGSNMQRATFSGRRGIRFSRALPVRVGGWRVVFDKPPLIPIGESFANLVPDPDAEALGVAYEIEADDLEHVLLTEGVRIGNYREIEVDLVPLHGDATPLRGLSLSSDRRDDGLRPSTRYMALIIEGALEHGLPAEYVDFLRGIPARTPSTLAAASRPLIDQFLKRPAPK